MKSKVTRILQLVVTIGLAIWLLRKADVSHALAALSETKPVLLLAVLAIMTLSRLLMPVKWRLLLEAKGIYLSVSDAIRTYYVSSFVGALLPATLGGDGARLYLVARRGFKVKDILLTIVLERMLGLVVIASLALIGTVVLPRLRMQLDLPLDQMALVAGLLAAATLAGVIVVQQRSRDFRGKSGVLFAFAALTLLESFLVLTSACVVIRAFGMQLPLLFLFSVLPLQVLLARLPLSLAGWGVHEAGFVYFLSLAGIPVSVGLAVGVLHHILQVLALTPGALWLASAKGVWRDAAVDART